MMKPSDKKTPDWNGFRGTVYRVLRRLFRPDPSKQEAERLYAQIVAVARTPAFYRRFAVPDNADGRLDSVMLHLCLVLFYYQERDKKLTRCLTECFIRDMDRNLLEMGISDLRLGRWVRKVAYALNGRFIHYQEALKQPHSTGKLAETLQRNLYRGSMGSMSTGDLRAAPDPGAKSSSPSGPLAGGVRKGSESTTEKNNTPPPVLQDLCDYVRAQYAHTQQNHGSLRSELLDRATLPRSPEPKTGK